MGNAVEDSTQETLPYWLVNVPPRLRPAKCPDFLLDVSDRDRELLEMPDAEYEIMSWPKVQEIIRTNSIDQFQRKPSDLRRYREYNWKIKKEHGSVMDFVVNERLGWTDQTPKGPPFTEADDVKILYNDWPYGIDPLIVHLVAWVKFELDEDAETGDLSKATRKTIDDYVEKTFCEKVPADRVRWFRNWSSLKSIHSVEHIHVMLYDPDLDFVRELTGGDMALMEKLKQAEEHD